MLSEDGRQQGIMLYNKADSSNAFETLLRQKRIKFPDITKEKIEDRSKTDALAKCIAIGQTGWFVLQCIARLASGLVITELELITLALATLNAFMYFLWWNKPFDVQTQVPVYLIEPDPNVEPISEGIPGNFSLSFLSLMPTEFIEDFTEGGVIQPFTRLGYVSAILKTAFFSVAKASNH